MKIPNFEDPHVTKFLTEWDREIKNAQRNSLSRVTANHSVLLQSPNKDVWEVTVTDAGALQVVKIQG